MIGPGRYDDECTFVRMRTHAAAVLLIVTHGDRGNGFSVQTESPALLATLPNILRYLADHIEAEQCNAERRA